MRTKTVFAACVTVLFAAGCGNSGINTPTDPYRLAVQQQDWQAVCDTLGEPARQIAGDLEAAMLAHQGNMVGAEAARIASQDRPGENCNLGLELAAPHLNYRMSVPIETKTVDGAELIETPEGRWMVDGNLIVDAPWVGDALNLIAGQEPQ